MLELSARLRESIIVNASVNGHGPVVTNVSTETLANPWIYYEEPSAILEWASRVARGRILADKLQSRVGHGKESVDWKLEPKKLSSLNNGEKVNQRNKITEPQ